MRIGINGSSLIAIGSSADAVAAHAGEADRDGFATYWVAQLIWPDALTLIAAVGSSTESIRFGTAVVPTWPRHPLMLAAQALTTSHVVGGRLTLGIGLAHKVMVEEVYRVPFTTPAKHMREYLDVLLPAMESRSADTDGDIWSANLESFGVAEGTTAPSVMLAAMGPRMLELAGSRTDGTILWLSGPRAVESEIAPTLRSAAESAGRSAPQIVASVPVCVTDKPDEVREVVAGVLANYNELPSYRRMMDIEGVDGPANVSLIGTGSEVLAGLERYASAGVTEFSALEFTTNDAEAADTRALLREYNS
ncbi:MAG: TIGR03564 family F420-dependent LLM class oxidoreductase [Microthrixaceae bacterium]|nr:TIGR03564 family F420-dependent LLM class oxidoreductase [Microthrixaceae bacterium]MCB1011992.1 TIGR03564 family F420-dependent LLM class oxidoreductase [Microthrixaceae bacterium]